MNNNTFVHKYIKPLIRKDDLVVDMTAGNGNDTLFLSKLAGKVIAFDISKEAIRRCKEKLKDCDNVVLINDDHVSIDKYLQEKARLFIFNLGYLPNSDEKTITQAEKTLIAFKKAYELLEDKGYLIVTFYRGHKGGKDEYYLLSEHINKNRFHIYETYCQPKLDAPVTVIIRKDQSSTSI
ncbi:MAG: class I SAM-dependent methyltransferase [Erysipelotrichaceae bacterium]|nr:class I SAM-dependent methyltransferase [Erysipelotrichaceae bacterium]